MLSRRKPTPKTPELPSTDVRRVASVHVDLAGPQTGPGTVLDMEPRRALAVLRGLALANDAVGLDCLFGFAGVEPRREGLRLTVDRADCAAIADCLRQAGYALDDAGVERFKAERGYSRVVRIGPEIAGAYARYAGGSEARLSVDPAELRQLTLEARRALRLMLLIGRDPGRLMRVRAVLGLEEREPRQERVLPVGKVSAKRLLEWGDAHGISFSDPGLSRLARALDLGEPAPGLVNRLAQPVARWIIADDEPVHDYGRMAVATGEAPVLISRRTYSMLSHAEALLGGGGSLKVARGSYEKGTRGAHPHQGGGVVDVQITGNAPEQWVRAVAALRTAGFAAWYRPRPDDPHLHAIAVGDRDLAPAAEWQVKGYFQGRDGRSRSEPDPHARLAVILPHWVRKYGVRYA